MGVKQERELTVRVGLCQPSGSIASAMEARGLPVLVSANAFFDHRARCFREIPVQLADLDVALDSAGFVALSRYKRFPWSVRQYVHFAFNKGFSWWSAMDACCEPEISADRSTILNRVRATADLLRVCQIEYVRLLDLIPEGRDSTGFPMPILQGWLPEDYERSAALTDFELGGKWPEMVGVGSVCRRRLSGPDGLWRVLERLDTILPPQVKLHLFGVKGRAIEFLRDYPRVVSIDSMAFEFQARMDAMKSREAKTVLKRVACMDQWIDRQLHRTRVQSDQMRLGFV